MTRKIYILIAFLLALMLFGCQQTEPVQNPANQLPTMKVRIGEETFSTARGGYCWTTGNQSECTDASGNPFDYGTSAPPPSTQDQGASSNYSFLKRHPLFPLNG